MGPWLLLTTLNFSARGPAEKRHFNVSSPSSRRNKKKHCKINETGKHNNVLLRSFKHYTVNLFDESLRNVRFLNYERFSNKYAAYTDFLNKLIKVINYIAPSKEIKIMSNNKDWFDWEDPDWFHAREKLFLKF